MTHDSSSKYVLIHHDSRLTIHDGPEHLKRPSVFILARTRRRRLAGFPSAIRPSILPLLFLLFCVCVWYLPYDTGCRMPSALLLPSTKDDGGKTLGQGAVTFGIFGSPATACFSTSDPRVSYLRKIY